MNIKTKRTNNHKILNQSQHNLMNNKNRIIFHFLKVRFFFQSNFYQILMVFNILKVNNNYMKKVKL